MGGLLSFLGAVRTLLSGGSTSRWRILLAYTRLRIRVAVLRGRSEGRRVNVLGWTLEAPDLPGFTFVFEEIFVRGEYHFEAGTSAPTIIDAGANVGLAVAYFKHVYPHADVLAFEPDPRSFEALRANVAGAGWSNVDLHQAAVGGRRGSASLTGDRRYRSVEGPGEIAVVALSEHIDGPVDLLKLDVEGAETDVLSELAASGKLPLIRQMAIEYHHHLSGAGDSFSVLLSILEDAGFGYALEARAPAPPTGFQDVLVRAYRPTT